MVDINFISVRLGKDSIPDIERISSSKVGIIDTPFTINVRCTQIPDNYKDGDYAFIWLGSDNNKGAPTKWKQGFKAVGRVTHVNRAANRNDTSETGISILYVFNEAVNRMDILRCAPIAYYWCAGMPLVGIDDHANQTIRTMSGGSFADMRAFFSAIQAVSHTFHWDIVQVEPRFKQLFDAILPLPKDVPMASSLPDAQAMSQTSSTAVVAQYKSLSSFAYDIFRYLERKDSLRSLEEAIVWSKASNYNGEPLIALKSQISDTRLVNVFIEKSDKPSQTYYYDTPFNFNGRNVYLNNGWASDNANRPDLTLQKLALIVNEYYAPYLRIVEINGRYELRICESTSNPLQRIFYGAPGTGKSYGIDDVVCVYPHVRTTFHPDSDYATFVGAYKPTMKTNTFTKNGVTTIEEQIVYSFVPQAFLKAYVNAWKQMPKPYYLVIEEINRGNCAQIFGDLFQLLDRDDDGYSKYPIEADEDIKRFLSLDKEKGFAALTDEQKKQFPDELIWKGEKLVLPKNLHIWASMNTSDQSLFPIDAAFKRRWDWKYIPIANGGKGWKIEVCGQKYDWWKFLEEMNDIIEDATSSEDKKLGYYFTKADDDGIISAEKFVSKVVFYLWNDVFKDYGFDRNNANGKPIFKDANGKDMTFRSFFKPDGEIKEEQVKQLLENMLLQIDGDKEGNPSGDNSADEGNTEVQS